DSRAWPRLGDRPRAVSSCRRSARRLARRAGGEHSEVPLRTRQGRWNLEAGQLVLVDESSLAGTLALDRIAEHAAEVGAKVVLIGDWAQLSAVETGGAFGMLVRDRDQVPELTDVRRFANEWEKSASLGLRHGSTDALDGYHERGRLIDGDAETMLNAIYEAWRTDRDEGLRTLMIAGTGEMVA